MEQIKDRVIYGAMNIGGGWNTDLDKETIEKGIKTLEKAYEIGIRIYDHANIYTMGKSESVFGEFLKANPIRKDLFIQSKAGIIIGGGSNRYDFSKKHLITEVEESLKRLNISYMDRFILHRPDPIFDRKELKSAIDEMFNNGWIKSIGVSNMSHYQIEMFEEIIERKMTCNQLELSLSHLDFINEGVDFNTPAYKESIVAGTLEYCMKKGIELQSWGAMSQGAFTGRNLQGYDVNYVRTAGIISRIAHEKNISKESVLLSWLMMHPAHIMPVVGTTSVSRLENIKDCMTTKLSRDEWYEIYISQRGYDLP